MSKGLSLSGLVLGILTLLLTIYIRFFLFTFNNTLELTLIYSVMIIGFVGLIINLVVLIKKLEGKLLSVTGLIFIILAVLIPVLFKSIA